MDSSSQDVDGNLLDTLSQREVIGGENRPVGRPLQMACLRDQYRGLFYVFNNNQHVGIEYNISKFLKSTSGSTEICYSEEPLHTGGMGQQDLKKSSKEKYSFTPETQYFHARK